MSFPVSQVDPADLLRWLKQNEWRRVTGDSTVQIGPCFLFHVAIDSDGNGDGDATLYDNPGGANGRSFKIYTVDESSHEKNFNPPLYFAQGLYVDVGTNCEAVTVHYRPVK